MTMPRLLMALFCVVALAACTPPNQTADDFITELPEAVVALAAPSQDLSAVVLKPEDGCYWYQYAGPVETTMLPLRTADGRPICTRTVTPDDAA